MRLLALVLCLFACTPSKPVEPEEPSIAVSQLYEDAGQRLTSFYDRGWVVSRWTDGTLEHQGDSLIWTAMALGAAPCAGGQVEALAIRRMLSALGGGIWRHPDLSEDASLEERAIAMRNCVLKLNPDSKASLTPSFDYLPRVLLWESGGDVHEPDAHLLHEIQVMALGWATAVKASHAAAFRVHLAMLALDTAEMVGRKLDPTLRAGFCEAAKGMDMPTVDNFCGRDGLRSWIGAFEFNAWEYRHQRAAAWETPDGKDGLETPGVDLLVALSTAYSL